MVHNESCYQQESVAEITGTGKGREALQFGRANGHASDKRRIRQKIERGITGESRNKRDRASDNEND
jgi:hypothetical protein